MCSNTKQKIAVALRQLMKERPFQKITVQNLMDATNMKRQSFYYHFQDTRDVLMWICQQELAQPLSGCDLEFTEWILYALTLLDKDRAFYRRVLSAAHPEFVREFGGQVIRPRVIAQLYGSRLSQQLNANEQFAVDFITQGVTNWMIQFICSRKCLDLDDTRNKVAYLFDTLSLRLGAVDNT